MLVAEQCFTTLNNSLVRKIRGRVELYSGSTLLQTFKHTDALKSLTIERVGESGKFFGFGIVHKLNVKVIDKERKLDITTANALDVAFGVGCDFIYTFPYFYVSQVHRDEITNELSITAYDALYKAVNLTYKDLALPQEYTIEMLAAACANKLGLALKNPANGFNTLYKSGGNFDGTETVRAVLDAIAEATQTIYYIDNNLTLTFKKLDVEGEAAAAITKDNYFTLDSGENKRLKTIIHATELGDNVSASITANGSTQVIRDNPLLEMRDDVDTLLQAAVANIGGITINQFKCNWRGNFLVEIGDKISLITKDNKTVLAYLLDDVITYDGAYKQDTQWAYTETNEETTGNPATLGEALKQTYAKVDKVNKTIDIVASETAANTSSIAALQLDTENINATVSRIEEETQTAIDGVKGDVAAQNSYISSLRINTESIAASVERVETETNATIDGVKSDISTLTNKVDAAITAEGVKLSIQEEMAKGVDKVYTSTGFSFDSEGLRISKTGSEMESLLDDNGLSVYRDSTEVLTADNTGVNGINMTVRQYLIIGGSRFEAYGGRTGCFWIG